jgi:hypothetical protein
MGWEWGMTANGHEFSFWGYKNVLEFYKGGVPKLLNIGKNMENVHFKV